MHIWLYIINIHTSFRYKPTQMSKSTIYVLVFQGTFTEKQSISQQIFQERIKDKLGKAFIVSEKSSLG